MNKNFFLLFLASILVSRPVQAMEAEVNTLASLLEEVQTLMNGAHEKRSAQSIFMCMADENGWTFLHDAAAHNRVDLVKSLFKYRCE